MIIISSLVFIPLYLLAILYCHAHFYRDPTSLFFRPELAYRFIYTDVRLNEARSYIEDLKSFPNLRRNETVVPKVCIGVPTVAREGVQYFHECVGSLFQGLSSEERQGIYFLPFIATSNASSHPVYHETWLHNIADSVLTYDQLEQIEPGRIEELESDSMHREKALLDYTLLLEKCASTGAEYVAMIEDDVISVAGWFHRMRDALVEAESKSHLRGFTTFLYLRLFYTEEFFGWNVEYWPEYVFWSMTVVLCTGLGCVCIRLLFPPCKKVISNRFLIVLCGLYTPMVIALFFAAGRMSVIGIPKGVTEMENFGCCGQSLVFPKAQIPRLLEWYRMKKIGFVDMLTEDYADETGELRWALVPSVMQHIGHKSSKWDDNDLEPVHQRSQAEKIWNFGFELYDPASTTK